VYSKVTLLVLILLFLLVSKASWNAYQNVRYTRANLERVQNDREELLERKRFIEEESAVLSSDEGLEEIIRERLPVAKEGERVIIIVDEKESEVATTTPDSRPWWKWW
jgi:cell division protein FtsB